MERVVWLLATVSIVLIWSTPLHSTEVSFSGHYEVKAFAYENVDLKDAIDDEASFVEHEFRLNIDLENGPVTGRLQINSGIYTWGENQDLPDDEWHREMFLTFPLGKAMVKVGRMEVEDPFKGLMYVDVRDGVKVIYPLSPSLSADISIWSMDEEDAKRDILYTLLLRYKPLDSDTRGALGWYFRAVNDSTASGQYTEDRPQWLVATVDTERDGLTIKVTGAYLLGDRKTDGLAYEYEAYAFDIRGGYDLARRWMVPLTFEVIIGYGSGDGDPNDRDLETFFGPSPAYLHGAVFKDVGEPRIGGVPEALNHGGIEADGIGNQKMFALNLTYQVTDRLSLGLFGARFWLTEERKANLNTTSGTTYRDNHLGDEATITADYLLRRDLTLHLQAGWFLPAQGMYQSLSAQTPADVVSEYLAMIGWEF